MKVLLVNFLGPEIWLILFLMGFIIPALLYINTINKTLDEIRDEYRLIPSRSPLLLLVPVLGNFILFLVVIKLSQSLEFEFKDRGILVGEKRPGLIVGLIMSIAFMLILLTVTWGLLGHSSFLLPFVRIIGIVGLVCWIVHWTKVASYKKILIMNRQKN